MALWHGKRILNIENGKSANCQGAGSATVKQSVHSKAAGNGQIRELLRSLPQEYMLRSKTPLFCNNTFKNQVQPKRSKRPAYPTRRRIGFLPPPALCNALPRHFLCFSRHWHIFCSKFKSSFFCKFQNCFINAFFVMYRFKFIVKITSPVQACCLLFQAMLPACHGLIIDAYKLLVHADRFFLTYGAVMQA